MVFRMSDLSSSDHETEEKRIVAEFCHLFEKSKQLFNGLRDLPPYGHKQWQNYFGRAFDVYTKLWKFQQQHRLVLDSKYSLKRWQIGEIASRIAQLYYHYYLRTSDTNYLNEAYQFYGAIRARDYFKGCTPIVPPGVGVGAVQQPNNNNGKRETERPAPDLIIKKLRYYARFIVVCLLLKRMKNVKELVREFSFIVEEYSTAYETEDAVEWNIVLSEIRSFIDADSPITVFGTSGEKLILTHRLTNQIIPQHASNSRLRLQEVLIVGTKLDQVRFSELTMDMYRMLQTLEREPLPITTTAAHAGQDSGLDSTNSSTTGGGAPVSKKELNPHKYLLYKPTVEILLVHLSSGLKDLDSNGTLLLYISADPVVLKQNVGVGNDDSQSSALHQTVPGYDAGGISMLRKDESTKILSPTSAPKKLIGQPKKCLHPGDLVPFTRKPFFLIIDSENSSIFQNSISPFGAPFVILMSAPETPVSLHDTISQGSILTLFLHCPLSGFCFITGIDSLTIGQKDESFGIINKFMNDAARLFLQGGRDDAYAEFFSDEFLRVLILRFIFYETVLRYHRNFQSPSFHPRSQPPLELSKISVQLFEHVINLAHVYSVEKMFFESE